MRSLLVTVQLSSTIYDIRRTSGNTPEVYWIHGLVRRQSLSAGECVDQQQYSAPRMTPHLRKENMKFEQYKKQFAFLRAHGISMAAGLNAVHTRTEKRWTASSSGRTILNVCRKKKRSL